MSTFPQLSTSEKEHGLTRSRGGVAQNDRSVHALQEARLNPLVSTDQHESQAPYTRMGMRPNESLTASSLGSLRTVRVAEEDIRGQRQH